MVGDEMSVDFNKGNAKAISGAGEAVVAYFEHFQRKYPEHIVALEKHIQDAAGKGLDSAVIVIPLSDRARSRKRDEIFAFNQFLRRYLEYLGYQLNGAQSYCWTNRGGRGATATPHDLKYVRVNSSWVGSTDKMAEIFVCNRRDVVLVEQVTVSWTHNFFEV